MVFPPEIFFFHCQYLVRSSKDVDLGRLRGWRRRPFPAFPYVGPWPEGLSLNGVQREVTPSLFWRVIGLNTRILLARGKALGTALPRAWRVWSRPRRAPFFPEPSVTDGTSR